MSGIAGSELVLLIIIGLIVLGPKRLPQVANQIGSWLGQARRMTRMMKRQLEEEVNFDIDKELGLKTAATAKPTGDVSSPEYVHERAAEKTDADTVSAEEEAVAELPDDYSPAHEADAPGTGVGDDAADGDAEQPEPVSTAVVDDAEAADALVDAEIAEPKKKESA